MVLRRLPGSAHVTRGGFGVAPKQAFLRISLLCGAEKSQEKSESAKTRSGIQGLGGVDRGGGLGRGLGVGRGAAATVTAPVIPMEQCAAQKYEYVPGEETCARKSYPNWKGFLPGSWCYR